MAHPKPTISQQLAVMNLRLGQLTNDFTEFRDDARKWMESADALIERNRCLDEDLQDAIIELGKSKLFRMEVARRTSQWRQRLNIISGTVLGFLAGVAALWGYVRHWVE